MQTQGLTTHLDGNKAATPTSFGDPTRRLALSALVVGIAVGAWSGWGLERVVAMTTPTTFADVPAPVAVAPASEANGARPTSTGRALAVDLPADATYLTTTAIPVAGLAYGRPHGPKVSSVHVELIADGRPLMSTDIPVYSGRFAGVLQLPALDDRVTAQLRISDPLHTGASAVIRTVTIDPR